MNLGADFINTPMYSELTMRGWTCVEGVKSRADLLELARTLGQPVPNPTGELVKELMPVPVAKSNRATLSNTYGTGPFPLHTDTAFWALPSRYIVLRARGDIRRPTTVLSFAEIFHNGPANLRDFAEHSVWLVRTPSSSTYCSMRLGSDTRIGWRYDPHCMIPVNDAAIKVKDQLDDLSASSRANFIRWTADMAVVICNWDVLHGRGEAPTSETTRILERIYVR